MDKLFGYLCPVCAHVEIVATRKVGAYHKALTLHGWRQHAMLEAGEFPATRPLESIKAHVLAMDWQNGVREIETESTATVGVVFEKAKQARPRVWRKARVRA